MADSFESGPTPGCLTLYWSKIRYRQIPTAGHYASSYLLLIRQHPPSRGGRAALRKRECGVDQTYVREGLGKVAQRGAGLRIDFLGQQTQIICITEQLL